MNILDALIQLRDDLKEWVTNNLIVLKNELDNKSFSGDYNALENAPITSDTNGDLKFVDEEGNVIFSMESNGIEINSLTLNGEILELATDEDILQMFEEE